MQRSSVLPKRVHQVLLQMHGKSAQRETAKHKNKSYDNFRERSSILIAEELKETIWNQKRDDLASEKFYSS